MTRPTRRELENAIDDIEDPAGGRGHTPPELTDEDRDVLEKVFERSPGEKIHRGPSDLHPNREFYDWLDRIDPLEWGDGE